MLSHALNHPSDTFEHTQIEALSVWSVVHGLNRPVAVAIYDDAGNQVFASVRILNSNELVIVNNAPATGKAVVR